MAPSIYNNGVFIIGYTYKYKCILDYIGSLSLLNVDLMIYDKCAKEGLNWSSCYFNNNINIKERSTLAVVHVTTIFDFWPYKLPKVLK
jgi:hypothetical protein